MVKRHSRTMKDRVTVQKITDVDSDLVETKDPQQTIDARYVKDAVRVRNDNGEVVRLADQMLTYTEVDESFLVWPPGADTSNEAEANRPTQTESASQLSDQSETLYKVTL